MTQPSLFTEPARLSGNRGRIIERLQKGPATNGELAQIGGLRFGGRIFELRKEGYDIRIVASDHETGMVTYRLF